MASPEQKVIDSIKKWGKENSFLCVKMKGATHNRGLPDLCLLGKAEKIAKPHNQESLYLFSMPIVLFVEVKALGKKPTEVQALKINELRVNGQYAFYADSMEMFNWWLSEIGKHLTAQALDSDVVCNLFGDINRARIYGR